MKNPFEKNYHKVLTAGIIIGSFTAGAAAYFIVNGNRFFGLRAACRVEGIGKFWKKSGTIVAQRF